jgi:siroheme synthase
MPGSDYERLARALRDAGISDETPCLIVSQASQRQESVYRTDVGSLASVPAPSPPALLVVGAVTAAAKAGGTPVVVGVEGN